MRNLKRALSLALASVMLLGMMVVGTSASFNDVGPEHNTEAIAVAEMLELMVGSGDGNFLPDKTVTREEMAGILAKLLLLDVDHFNGVSNFTDVAPGQWYAPAIAACAADGFFAGIGNGQFGLGTEMTVNQVGLLLCKVLGYFQTDGDYGENADLAATLQASKAGLFKGLDKASKDAKITRNQLAQMCLNALKATIVDKKAGSGVTVSGNGFTVTTGAAEYEERKIDDSPYVALNPENQPYTSGTERTVQLGEEVYGGDLKLVDNGKADDFGRPGKTWTYDNKKVASAEEPVVTYTKKVDADDIAKDLKGYTIAGKENGSDKTLGIDEAAGGTYPVVIANVIVENGTPNGSGQIATSSTLAATIEGLTGNGTLVEVYATDKAVTKIVQVKYTVGEVTKVATKGTRTTYTISNSLTGYVDTDEDVADTIVLNGAIAVDDIVTGVKIGSKSYVYPTTKVVGNQTAKSGTNTVKVTIGGTQYTVGNGVYTNNPATTPVDADDFTNSADEATYYIDMNNFVVSKKGEAASTNYAVVLGLAGSVATTVDGSTPSLEARVLLSDGTVGVYDVALKKDSGNWIVKGLAGKGNLTLTDGANVASSAKTVLGDVDTPKTFGYKLDGNTITFEDVTDFTKSMTGSDADKIVDVAINNTNFTNDKITKDRINYAGKASDFDGTTVLMDKNTKFVAYNKDDKSATTYVGASALPDALNGTTAQDGYVVMKLGSTGKTGTAKVVFLITAKGFTDKNDDIVYIDKDKGTEVLVGTENKVEYDAWTTDGDTIKLIADTALSESGLYNYTEDLTVSDDDVVSGDDRVIEAKSNPISITGNILSVTTDFCNLTGDEVIIFVDEDLDLDEANGNYGYVIKVADSNDVAAIFVVSNSTID